MRQLEISPDTNYVVGGGGQGGANRIKAVADQYPGIKLTGIAGEADDGGGSGRLRRLLDIGPMGDMRNMLAAASPFKEIGGDSKSEGALNTRFDDKATMDIVERQTGLFVANVKLHVPETNEDLLEEAAAYTIETAQKLWDVHGSVGSQTLGNLMMAKYAAEQGSITASDTIGEIVAARARILTTGDGNTLMMWDGQEVLESEHRIDTHRVHNTREAYVWLKRDEEMRHEVRDAIEGADIFEIAQGSPHTSDGAVLSKRGVRRAIGVMKSRGGIVLTGVNIKREEHDTRDWDTHDTVDSHNRNLQTEKNVVDGAAYNTNTADLGDRAYGHNDEEMHKRGVQAVGADIIGGARAANVNDNLRRTDVVTAHGAMNNAFEAIVAQIAEDRADTQPAREQIFVQA